MPIKVSSVSADTAAAAAGIAEGSSILSVNGFEISDSIDFMFAASDAILEIHFLDRSGRSHDTEIVREFGEPLGLSFEQITPVKCPNKCIFCFLDQMPRGLRPSLYVRDEDYRLSFLFGNFITATRLSDGDIDRIGQLHLSPLYISVHATDPIVRARMLQNPEAPPILPILSRLAEAEITIHTQIVLCPGINDGEVLKRTISDLISLAPQVATIAIVPVGLTKHRAGLPEIAPVTSEYARRLIEEMRPIQAAIEADLGEKSLFLSDEIYLIADEALPSVDEYGDFEQIENGVGLTSLFLSEVEEALAEIHPAASGNSLHGVILTGGLAAPVMSEVAEGINQRLGINLRVIPVANGFFGESVTVSGLLVGSDFHVAISGAELSRDELALIPDVALECEGEAREGDARRFIDGMTLGELKEKTGATVLVAPVSGSDFVYFLRDYLASV
ncbi:MAG: DUF512 domain-containing protein [Candidatus Coatesbacteria bacterium]|nr:DUF512 domain-containing protein [Candidatus Coatesbacteria bacterium]